MAVGQEEVEIVKPRTDKRLYRRIVLKNALEVLLISDPETDKVVSFASNLFHFQFLFFRCNHVRDSRFFCSFSARHQWLSASGPSRTPKALRALPIFSVS